MTGFRASLALSVAAHAACLALLLLLLPPPARRSPPAVETGIEVAVVPSLPRPPAPPPPQPPKPPPPPPPVVQPPPPPPPLPPPKIEPPPPAPEATVAEPPPPPPRKPRVPPLRRPVEQRPEREPPPRYAPPPVAPRAPAAPPQTAYVPAPRREPAPSAEVSQGYRAALGEWLERHKRYPAAARQRREQGRVVLRFTVDRSGRVDSFAIGQSSGYPDLDAAVERMMQGAVMPPFPADMPQPRIEVSVAIRFSLEQ